MKTSSKLGFTLIELLVVVSIITILLAILIPSLSTAMYQAKLAACGAHQKGMGTGMNTYAISYNRKYPFRSAVEGWAATFGVGGVGSVSTLGIYGPLTSLRMSSDTGATVGTGGASTGTTSDDRPIYKEYMALELFEDPMCERAGVNDPGTYKQGESVASSIAMWWGMGYPNNGTVLKKMDGEFSWKHPMSGKTQSYKILAADEADWYGDGTGGYAFSSHPDYDQRMSNVVRQSAPDLVGRFWASSWETDGTWDNAKWDKTTFDLNYLYTDGSVSRLVKVNQAVDRTTYQPVDTRLTLVPRQPSLGATSTAYQTDYRLLPKGQ